MNTLKLEMVSKEIKSKKILSDINVSLSGGKIYGLVGKNGSGKTMLIRAVSGLMRPTSGKIIFNNQQLYKDIDFIPDIGIIIENIGLYPEFSGFKNLKLLSNIRKRISDDEIKEAIKRVGLDPEDKQKVKKYSLGMRQRLTIAQAIMEHPQVLLLDEPTNSLDEDGINLLRTICRSEAKRGAIVVISSHNKEDIDQLSDEKLIIENGKIEVTST